MTEKERMDGSDGGMNQMVVPNALADVILLLGVDGNTGLTPVGDAEDVNVYDVLFELQYEAQVLSAISCTDMVNFYPYPHRADNYPPSNRRETFELQAEEMNKQRERMLSDFGLGSKTSFHPKKTSRSISVNPKMLLGRSKSTIIRPKLARKAVNTVPDMPISDEVINSISTFCFPDGLKVHAKKPESTTHFFVLTDISGSRSYMTCLTLYRPFLVDKTKPPHYTHAFVLTNLHGKKHTSCLTYNKVAVLKKDDQGNIYINVDPTEQEIVEEGSMRCYIPHCCVIISKFPYYTTMKECLSSMLSYIEKDPEEMTTFLKEYANIITHTPVPPAGNLGVRFKLYNFNVTLMPPTHPDKSVIDLDLHLTFLCFNAEEWLKILACILAEERIVFLSTNYALLTIIMESVMNLVLPFKWRFTYSTILPSSALGYLESPGTFMYGVHSRHKTEVEQVEGLVLVDIDEGTVLIPEADYSGRRGMENSSLHTTTVPNIPTAAASVFRNKWTHLKVQFDLTDTRRPFCYNLEAMREYRTKRIMAQNKYIIDTCLELMVNLFRDVVYKLRVEHNHFDKEKFLKEHSEDREFYQSVFKTDMFKVFLQERMKEKSDYWSDMEMKTRGFGHSRSSSVYKGRARRYTLSQIVPTDKREITLFCLKDVTELKLYVKNTILQISKAIEASDDYDERTSLQYLRALFYSAANDNLSAMKDFISLSTTNIRILPIKVVVDLYNKFSEDEKSKFMNLSGHEVILDCIEDSKGREGERKKIKMGPVEVPDGDLNYIQFEEIVSFKRMSNDYRTIEKLFEALTQERKTSTTEIKQLTFELFVLCWDDNVEKCSQVNLEENTLSEEEQILKISTLIKTDFGLGRIGLTDKRLFFLSDVSNHYKEIVKLREIKDLEQSEHSSLFSTIFTSRVQTLKIHKQGRGTTPFTAYLKEDRNWWYNVIREMWAGKVVAEAMKDVMLVQHAIQNTLLIDAIIASGQQDIATHSRNTEDAAKSLSYFFDLYSKGEHELPQATKDALQRKIDVNFGEKDSKTVQALLYTGGDEHISPRLWCGLSDGRIKVFNAVTWTLESEILVVQKQCVACLTAVDGTHVWAGTFGVYILDALTLTCTKALLNHTDLVVDIVLHDENRFVYTASLDGTIIKWSSQKLTRANEVIKLTNIQSLRSLKIYMDRLICGSWSSIMICDLEGSVLNTLQATQKERHIEIDSFTVAHNGEVWAGSRRGGTIHIWDISTGECTRMLTIDNCKGISSIEEVDGRMWIGTKDGTIYIYTVNERKYWEKLNGHEDAVRVLCDIRDRYMISGGGSKDGRVCIWNATAKNLIDPLSDEHSTFQQ